LNKAIDILLHDPPPPKSKVCGMTFHNMQRKEKDWVNPLSALGSQFFGGGINKPTNNAKVYVQVLI
jgi:hypothetical protein